MRGLRLDSTFFYCIAFLSSLLLSLLFAHRVDVVNPDAICYLESAKAFSVSPHYAMHLCDQAKWPFYSALIYLTATVTQFSFLHAAFFLNSILTALSVLFFLMIIRFLTPSKMILGLAAIIILFAHQFNEVREFIIRDHGFWAFYLLSIFFLLNYLDKPKIIYAFSWNISLIIATLFRVEGAIYLLLIPFVCFFQIQNNFLLRVKNFLKLYAPLFLVLFILMISAKINFTRLSEVQFQIFHGFSNIIQHFQTNSTILKKYILGDYGSKDAALILFLVISQWYFISLIMNISVIFSLLIFYAWFKKISFGRHSNLVLFGYLIVGMVITLSFLAENMFLSKRYLLALSLTFLIWVPFALNDLFHVSKKNKWIPFGILSIILLSGFFNIFYNYNPKTYIRVAGEWIDANIPQNKKIFTNDYQLMYYSQRFKNNIFQKRTEYLHLTALSHHQWEKYDYLALRLKKSMQDKELLSEISEQSFKIFAGKHGERIAIYKINH